MKILFADDERNMRILVSDFLEKEGYEVITAENGKDALEKFWNNNDFSLVILDVMMPSMDGWEVLEEIRKISRVPVIMLTAKSEECDELMGFNTGADEYITKPFSPRILVARVNAILKRSYPALNDDIKVGIIEIKSGSLEVFVKGKRVDLSKTEYNLLNYFIANTGITLTREQLLDNVWGYGYEGTYRTVDTHINRLRMKLKEAGKYIETVRGYGYRFGVKE